MRQSFIVSLQHEQTIVNANTLCAHVTNQGRNVRPDAPFSFILHVLEERESIRVLFYLSFKEKNGLQKVMPTQNSENNIAIPRINIVLLIVGTRGDVQPFIA
jgi:hypothetical protein